MGPMISWTNASFTDQGATEDFYLDMEIGTDTSDNGNNTFSVQLPDDIRIAAGSAVYIDDGRYGGLVQKRISNSAVEGILQWEGRTWEGVLADRVLVPDAGQAYNTASGTDKQCITDLLARLGVTDLFEAGDGTGTAISYQYPRYPDGFTALVKMLASKGLRPTFYVDTSDSTAKVVVDSVAIATLGEVADADLADVEICADLDPYNHAIGLGQGEGVNRTVLHRYADSSGNVSTTKSITGMLERVIRYENVNDDAEALAEDLEDFLKDLQGQGTVEVDISDEAEAALCDKVTAYDSRVNASVTVPITKQVVKVEGGIMTVSCEAAE